MPGTLVAGQDFAVLEPLIKWNLVGGTLPDPDVPYGGNWGGGWSTREIVDTVNGLAVTKRNPRTPVVGERLGRLGQVRSGDAGVAVGMQLALPTFEFMKIISSLSTVDVAAAAHVDSLLVGAGNTATTAVSVTVRLDTGNGALTDFVVSIPASTDATGAATAIRGAAYTGYTTGGTGATVTFTATATGRRIAGVFVGSGSVTGTMTQTRQGNKARKTDYLNEQANNNVMLGFEGIAQAGSLFEVDTMIRGLCYKVENTENVVSAFRWTGVDAVVRPTVAFECLPSQILDPQLVGTSLTRPELDPKGKFNYMRVAV